MNFPDSPHLFVNPFCGWAHRAWRRWWSYGIVPRPPLLHPPGWRHARRGGVGLLRAHGLRPDFAAASDGQGLTGTACRRQCCWDQDSKEILPRKQLIRRGHTLRLLGLLGWTELKNWPRLLDSWKVTFLQKRAVIRRPQLRFSIWVDTLDVQTYSNFHFVHCT